MFLSLFIINYRLTWKITAVCYCEFVASVKNDFSAVGKTFVSDFKCYDFFFIGLQACSFEWYQAFYRIRVIRWGIGNIKLKNDIAFRLFDVAYCRIYFIADKWYILKWKLGVCASVSELILNITLKISVSSVLHWIITKIGQVIGWVIECDRKLSARRTFAEKNVCNSFSSMSARIPALQDCINPVFTFTEVNTAARKVQKNYFFARFNELFNIFLLVER